MVEALAKTDFLGFPVYNTNVIVAPTLLAVRSTNPATDSGFPSGHTNAAFLAAYALSYAIPERYQELLVRATELGHNRIVCGMHSPFHILGWN
jgi:membrane-associated phospholipid phosphatase